LFVAFVPINSFLKNIEKCSEK